MLLYTVKLYILKHVPLSPPSIVLSDKNNELYQNFFLKYTNVFFVRL